MSPAGQARAAPTHRTGRKADRSPSVAQPFIGRPPGTPDLLGGDNHHRRSGVRLRATARYDIWLLKWPPGTRVSPHDHGDSLAALTVIKGTLTELRWNGQVPEPRTLQQGDTVLVERGVIHDVLAGDATSYSLHVYSPPLTSMTYYATTDSGNLVRVDEPLGAGGLWMTADGGPE